MQDIWRASEIEIIHLQPCIYRLLYQNFMVIANQKSLTEEGKEEGKKKKVAYDKWIQKRDDPKLTGCFVLPQKQYYERSL